MRKFGVVFKEKQNILEKNIEEKLLNQFKAVYSSLLESYGVNEFYDLDNSTQKAFLTEINKYWTEEGGLQPKGEMFLKSKQTTLTESSTELQKKNFLKKKSLNVITETLRQSNIKTNLYKVLDEMYRRTNSTDISNVLPAKMIAGTLMESFGEYLQNLMTEVLYEISTPNELNEKEFSKEKKKN